MADAITVTYEANGQRRIVLRGRDGTVYSVLRSAGRDDALYFADEA